MDRTFVIADLHLGHSNVLKHDGRPFPDIATHDAAIKEGILETVPEGGKLWLLGDLGRRKEDVVKLLAALRKKRLSVNLVRGNHDDFIKGRGPAGNGWQLDWIYDVAYFKQQGRKFFLSHYPHASWRGSNHGSYHVHGHCHGAMGHVAAGMRRIDVGANVIGYRPMSLARVVELLETQPYNNQHEIGNQDNKDS